MAVMMAYGGPTDIMRWLLGASILVCVDFVGKHNFYFFPNGYYRLEYRLHMNF